MLVYTTCRVLCLANAQKRYASIGIGGSGWATGAAATKQALALNRINPPTRELNWRTSPSHRKSHQKNPKPKLTSSNDRKPDGNGNALRSHRAYPTTPSWRSAQNRSKLGEFPDLTVKTTCARRVQTTNMKWGTTRFFRICSREVRIMTNPTTF